MIKYLHCTKKGVKKGADNYPFPKKDELLWILATDLDEKIIKKISHDFSIDSSVVKSLHTQRFSKIVSLNPFHFIFVDYTLVDHHVIKAKNLFIIKDNVFIIFTKDSAASYSKYFDKIYSEIERDHANARISYLLYRILEEDVEEDYDLLKITEEKLGRIEEEVVAEKTISPKDLLAIKKQLFSVTKSFWASTKIIFALRNNILPVKVEKADMVILEDLSHTRQYQLDMIFSQKEIITDLLQIRAANIANVMNKVMKTLTALTVIIAVPTLVASMYGMNFKYIPLAEPVHGFYTIGIGIGLSMLALYFYFLKRDWL